MWARASEVCLGCWLLVSPFVFRTPAEETLVWVVDFVAGALIIAIGLVACWHRAEKLHFLQLAVSAGLVLVAFVAVSTPVPGDYQNFIVVGLLLLIVGVVPTRAILPPRSWELWLEQNRNREGRGA